MAQEDSRFAGEYNIVGHEPVTKEEKAKQKELEAKAKKLVKKE